MRLKLKFIFLFCFLSSISFASVDDSTGVILMSGKVFILHKVENGQGIFGVARRYKVSWTSVRDANPGSESKLLPGQTLVVPTGKTEKQFFGNKTPKYSKNAGEYTRPVKKPTPEREKPKDNMGVDNSPKTSFTIFYTVKKGETLFSIAQKFNTTVDFLKQLNKLKTEAVAEGKDILVPMNDETDPDVILAQKEAEAKKVQKELDEMAKKIEEEKRREKARLDSTNNAKTTPKTKEEISKKEDGKPAILKTEYSITTENFPEYDVEKITETGYGKVTSDSKINQTKDWVIHHNAPENTIILITNPANNKTVYAKVVKNFTRDENDPLIIYLTKNTAEYLELNKKDKFSIKISFAK